MKTFFATTFVFIIGFFCIIQDSYSYGENNVQFRVVNSEWIEKIELHDGSSMRPADGKQFLSITLETTKDGSFDSKELNISDSSKNIYTFRAVDPKCKSIWFSFVPKTGILINNVKVQYHYDNKSSKMDFNLSFSNKNLYGFSWTGGKFKFRLLFEVKEKTTGFKLKFKDQKLISIKPEY
jgi:hypothetical protein